MQKETNCRKLFVNL